jgi:hypothetical protein
LGSIRWTSTTSCVFVEDVHALLVGTGAPATWWVLTDDGDGWGVATAARATSPSGS